MMRGMAVGQSLSVSVWLQAAVYESRLAFPVQRRARRTSNRSMTIYA